MLHIHILVYLRLYWKSSVNERYTVLIYVRLYVSVPVLLIHIYQTTSWYASVLPINQIKIILSN